MNILEFLQSVELSDKVKDRELSQEIFDILQPEISKHLNGKLLRLFTELDLFNNQTLKSFTEQLLQNEDESIKKICEPLIENQFNNYVINKTGIGYGECNDKLHLKFVEMIPHIFKHLKCKDIISIQSMTQPIGSLYYQDIQKHIEPDGNEKSKIEIKDYSIKATSRKFPDDIKIPEDLNFDVEGLSKQIAEMFDKSVIDGILDSDSSFEKFNIQHNQLSETIKNIKQHHNCGFIDFDTIVTSHKTLLKYEDELLGHKIIINDSMGDTFILTCSSNDPTISRIMFAPYTLLMNGGMIINPINSKKYSTLLSRYTFKRFDGGEKYYKVIKIV